MNERIKELAAQAEAYADEKSGAFRGEMFMRCFTEKFYELVRHDERNKFVKFLMDLHEDYKGDHNYYHFAANLFKEQA